MALLARKQLGVAVAAVLVIAVALAGGARTAATPRLLTLNPITIANGTATVSGSVGGDSAAAAQLSVNGHPVALDASGGFGAVVNLDGSSTLGLTVANPQTGQTVQFQIPLTGALIGPGGVIPASVLDGVEQAGAKLLEPAGGFRAITGQPLTIGGAVADRDQLAGLAVNGKDVMPLLGPDQTFTTQLPGTTKEVTLTARDSQGVTQTTNYRVLDSSAPLATAAGQSVTAAQAIGVKIAKVRYFVKGVTRTKRLRMVVTVKDRRGYLVRGAKVTVRARAKGRLVRRTQIKKSGRTGLAGFVLRVRKGALGKRLVMVTVARTPTAKGSKTSSVRLARAHPRSHK
jgi:hypothetical protein